MGGVSVRYFGKLFVVGSASYRRLSRPLRRDGFDYASSHCRVAPGVL
jgi:hypothetical protein